MTPQPSSPAQTPQADTSRDEKLQAAMFRLGKVDDEISAGYEILGRYAKTVTIFGSARLGESSPYYQAARAAARQLAQAGYAVITGGGPGIMEAGNRGAFEVGGDSIGFNITLPFEQNPNPHTTAAFAFRHFAPRKIVMTLYADAYVFFPGGFGTLDELSEIITLVQTGKTARAPIILFGSDFWNSFDAFVKQRMLGDLALISPGDEQLYHITDSIDDVVWRVKNRQL